VSEIAAEGAAPAAASGADRDDAYEPPLTDWTLRPFAGRSPLAVAAALAAGLVLISQLVRAALTELPPGPLWRDPYLWLDVLNGVLFAYIPAALWLLRRGRLRDLRELRPYLREGVSYRAQADAVLCISPRRLAVAGFVGALALGVLPTVDEGFWEGPRPGLTEPVMLFFVVRMALSGWLGGRAAATEVTAIAAFARLGANGVRVELLDLRRFEVFARAGLRSALAWVLNTSLVSLFWLGPGAGSANAVIVGTILLAVGFGFFACIHGPQRAIAAARREALAAVDARIARAGGALAAGREPADAGVRLADLVAWRAVLEQVREWPIGASSLARAALITALAVGSWLGGVLVERAVDRVFG
jgi:hypothetical protein